MNGVLREEGLGLLSGDGGVDDNVFTLLPVDRSCDTVLVTDLEGCDAYQHVSGTVQA